MIKNLENIVEFINDADNFLVTAHMNADGDAYASMLAVANVLEQLNKKYKIIINDETIESKYSYMWGFNKIQSYSSDMNLSFDAAIVLDVPSLKRIGNPAKLLPSKEFCVKIDHHPFEDDFAVYNYVDINASSTSNLIYELFSIIKIEMNTDLANLIFSGIMYDTGRFSFSNTNLKDFRISSELLKHNVKPSRIANHIFFNNSFQSMKTIGYGLANMESYLDGKLAIIFLPLEIMQKNSHSEIEELANFSVAIKDVEVGLFIREVETNFLKVSFRSKGKVNVNAIARAFGGGGHEHAAGCRFKGTFRELKQKLLKKVQNQL